jgi:hypothetical protein
MTDEPTIGRPAAIFGSISLPVPSKQMTVFCMADRGSVARAGSEIYARALRIEETPKHDKTA